MLKKAVLFILASCCSLALWLATENLVIGLKTEPSAEQRISFSYTDATGRENVCESKSLEDGSAHFCVPHDARHFYFLLEPNDKPYRLKAMTVFGIPFFSAGGLSEKVKPRDGLHPSGFIEPYATLDVLIKGDSIKPLDYERFFNALLLLYFFGRIGSIIAPFLLLLGFFVFSKRQIILKCFDTLSLPKFLFVLLLVCSITLSVPPLVVPVTEGLDPSWMWLLNKFALAPVYGREIIFTYGPLGFLLVPQMFFSNVCCAFIANIIFFSLWAFLTLKVFSYNKKAAILLLLALLFPHDNLEWDWVMLAISCLAFPVCVLSFNQQNLPKHALFLIGCAGALVPLVTFMKFSSLVSVFTTQLFFLSYGLYIARGNRVKVALAYILPLCFFFMLAYFSFFTEFIDFCNWVIGSLQIASGYNKYMVVSKSFFEMSIPFVLLFIYGLVVICSRKVSVKNCVFLILCSPIVFCTLKYSLVRQSVAPFCYALVACFALWTVVVPQFFKIKLLFGCILFFITMCSEITCRGALHLPNVDGAVQTIIFAKTFEQVAEKRPESNLPIEWLELLNGKSVQTIPHDFGDLMSLTNVTITPIPCLQLYSSYTPSLDALTAQFYRSSRSPDFVVCQISTDSIDRRSMLLDNPQAFRALVENYDCVAQTNATILLKRRKMPLKQKCQTSVTSCVVRVNEWVDIPSTATHFSIDWSHSFIGKMCTLFLRNTQTFVRVEFADGTSVFLKILPENLTAMTHLDTVFSKTMDACWKEVNPQKRPVRMRFWVETPSFYANEIEVKWHR